MQTLIKEKEQQVRDLYISLDYCTKHTTHVFFHTCIYEAFMKNLRELREMYKQQNAI